MRLLTTVNKPDRCSDSHLRAGLLAVGWEEHESFYMSFRQVCMGIQEDFEIVLNLGLGMVRSNSARRVLIRC